MTNEKDRGMIKKPYRDKIPISLSNVLDRMTDYWYCLIPVAVIPYIFYKYGLNVYYVAALLVGIIAWAYWGNKVTARDPKLALVVDVEKGIVSPLLFGRKRWAAAEKIGHPYLLFSTPGGLSVEIIKNYDQTTNTIVYPDGGPDSDIYIAAIPQRYGELIDELVKIKKDIYRLSNETELDGLRVAGRHIGHFSDLVNSMMQKQKKVE